MKEDVLQVQTLTDGPSLAARLRPSLIRFFKRKTGNTVDAEDLTQDVLVSALAHSDWKTPEEARGYIFRTAINRLHDRRRRLKTQGLTMPCTEALLDKKFESAGSQNPLERVLIVQEELSEIDRALEELSMQTRTVMVLIKLEQLKPNEVAEMLGISVRAVNKHVQKGMAHLARTCEFDELSP